MLSLCQVEALLGRIEVRERERGGGPYHDGGEN